MRNLKAIITKKTLAQYQEILLAGIEIKHKVQVKAYDLDADCIRELVSYGLLDFTFYILSAWLSNETHYDNATIHLYDDNSYQFNF